VLARLTAGPKAADAERRYWFTYRRSLGLRRLGDTPMSWLHAIFFNWQIAVAINLVALLFFGGLTIYFLLANKRAYLPGVLLIDLAILTGLVRVFFFFELSAYPTTPGGYLRLIGAVLLISGSVLLERARRRDRVNNKAKS
jgi:hypothetical protein